LVAQIGKEILKIQESLSITCVVHTGVLFPVVFMRSHRPKHHVADRLLVVDDFMHQPVSRLSSATNTQSNIQSWSMEVYVWNCMHNVTAK